MKILRTFFTLHDNPGVSVDGEIRYKKTKKFEDFPLESNKDESKFKLHQKYGRPPLNISLQDIKEHNYPKSFVDGISFTVTEDKRELEPVGQKQEAWDACLFDSKEWFNTMTEKKRSN